MRRDTIKKSIIISGQFVLCLLIILFTIFFGCEFIFRYIHVSNEAERYFDEEHAVVYHAQATPFYGLLFVICLVALIVTCRWTLKTLQGQSSHD
jgi:hypothetical protein